MLVIGLTGGIGSGKSEVSKLFAGYDVPIIDADIIANQVTKPGQPAFLAILKHFKIPLLLENGQLDRKKLRKIIFDNQEERHWLEKLLHPLIREEIERQIENLKTPYCITVIPLLFESEPFPFIHRFLVVDAPQHLQISRVAARDHIPKSHVKEILKIQVSRKHRTDKAHDVIKNVGILANLVPQVKKLHEKYLELSHCKNSDQIR